MNKLAYGVSTLALLSAFPALAQPAGATGAGTGPGTGTASEVIVTGTRQTGVRAADSAQPIEVVGAQALSHVGQPDLTQALQQNVPSFNVQQYGADTAALTVQAALRGLNPNDTLVLVNGKRRHATANLSVDTGSPYSGSATVDLSYIPVGAIDHVEVLQDGAAAQYGTDAIAGVVNIILKKADHGGTLSATGGEYYEGDGATGAWSINKGFGLGDKGYVNVTVEERYHDYSRQGGADRRLFNPDGTILSSVSGLNLGVLNQPGSPKVNNIYGDPAYNIYDGFFNGGYNLTDTVQLYAFGSYGQRIAQGYENYRVVSKVTGTSSTGATVVPFPTGFSPREKFHENDYSFTAGIKGDNMGWHWDLSTTYGQDHDGIATVNSANAQLFPVLQALSATPVAPQRNFDDGAFQSTELTNNLDIDRAFAIGLASPLNVAIGGEYRRDTFSITAGEPSSYYGAGAQSFDGYTPLDQGNHSRSNYAFYGDLAADVITGLHVDVAGRYEHYSDFGDTTVGKLTGRYDFNPMIAVRGTVSTGFRAPTLQEEYYSGTNVSPSSADVVLPANSSPALLAGFGPLKPETSNNYSVGFVAHPIARLQITGDFYRIDLKNRILESGLILGSSGGAVISQGVLNAITAKGVTLDSGLSYAGISIFSNAANTSTQGVELTASYASDFDEFGHVDWSVGFDYNDTKVTKQIALPAVDTNVAAGQTAIQSPNSLSALLTGAPKEKAILDAYWTLSKWSVNLRETIYGPTSELVSFDGTGSGAGLNNVVVPTAGITDLEVGYRITSALRLNVGANNLFDQRPTKIPTVSNGSGGFRPADGNNVYGEPAQFSPYGINGGYYYGRVTYAF